MNDARTIREANVWQLLETVADPEVPVLNVVDLGLIRSVELPGEDSIKIAVTPTYTGCPATDVINMGIRMVLIEAGFTNIEIQTVLSPAWTTEWMTEAGRQKLKAYGIAPPNPQQIVCSVDAFQQDEVVQCPHCNSYHTTIISRFGSTACKALYRCLNCQEPFDYFKCH